MIGKTATWIGRKAKVVWQEGSETKTSHAKYMGTLDDKECPDLFVGFERDDGSRFLLNTNIISAIKFEDEQPTRAEILNEFEAQASQIVRKLREQHKPLMDFAITKNELNKRLTKMEALFATCGL
jgi:hypothetical protein